MKLKNAAQNTAYCGRSTRVDTMVAIELAASCKPFRKSNSSATAISPIRRGRASVASTVMALPYTCSITMRVDLVGDVVETVRDLFEMLVDLDAHHEVHRVGVAMLEEQFLQPDVVQVVDAAFQLADLLGDRRQLGDVVADRLASAAARARPAGRIRPATAPISRIGGSNTRTSNRMTAFAVCCIWSMAVVHRRDQVLDVAAVERGDEGAAHRGQHLAGDAVGVVLELADALAEHRGFVAAAHHVLQGLRALHEPSGHDGRTGRKTALPGAKRHETSAAWGQFQCSEQGREAACHKTVIDRFGGKKPSRWRREPGHPPLCKAQNSPENRPPTATGGSNARFRR